MFKYSFHNTNIFFSHTRRFLNSLQWLVVHFARMVFPRWHPNIVCHYWFIIMEMKSLRFHNLLAKTKDSFIDLSLLWNLFNDHKHILRVFE